MSYQVHGIGQACTVFTDWPEKTHAKLNLQFPHAPASGQNRAQNVHVARLRVFFWSVVQAWVVPMLIQEGAKLWTTKS